MKEKFLPIGSVVLLKEAKEEIMITSYCIIPLDDNKENGKVNKEELKMYDYGGCIYPAGIIDNNAICGFNHDQIDKVLFVGYESDKQKQLNDALIKNYNKILDTVKQQIN